MEKNEKYFRKGSKVEVWSQEDGFQNAWFPAVIVQTPYSIIRSQTQSPKKKRLIKNDNPKAVVRYDHMLSEDNGKPLVEKVDVFLLRPVPPTDNTSDRQGFEPNDVVDALYNDIWWTGVVVTVVHDSYTVFFEKPPDVLEFKRSELRPHWDWDEPNWVRPQKQAFPESVFGPGTAVEVNLNSESWVPAVVLVEYGTNLALVRYKKSADNGEEQVLVKQTVQLEQIRPQPPEIKNDKSFDLLEKVDAYCDSSWSVGLVTKILQERRYVVFFKLEEKVKEFNHSQLRPHLDWFDGQWVTNSGEVLFPSGCQEHSNHECTNGNRLDSPLLTECSGSTMNDTEKEAPCSTNKPDNQKELSLLVESSEKEKVNHTSNGDKSTEVIVVSDNEKSLQQEVGEGKRREIIPVGKRARVRESEFTIPWPGSLKKCRSTKMKLKDLQPSGTDMGLKAADKDIFELKYVVEESKIYGTLEELKGAMDSHIENSGHRHIEGEQSDVVASGKINRKGEQPESLVANSQAEAAEELSGTGGFVSECVTDKPHSPVTRRVELTVDKASPMQTEEIPLTNVDESDAPEDGRALTSPTSASVVSADKVLPTQIEKPLLTNVDESDAPEDEQARTDKALPMQIEETPLTNVDESGTIEQEDSQNLPFVKSSPIWKLIESMDMFKKLPQKPHFHPLVKCKEIKREASAIKNMVDFAYLTEKISKLQEDDCREYFNSMMEELTKLEEMGFNVEVAQSHLNEWLHMKDKLEELQNESKQVEIHFVEHTDKKTKIDGELAEINKEIKKLEEKRAMLRSESTNEALTVSKFRAKATVIKEAISCTRESFRNRRMW